MEVGQAENSGADRDDIFEIVVEPTETVVEGVVRAVATATGRDMLELRPLFDVIDPDAIETLFDSGSAGDTTPDATLTFTYEGCTVETDGDRVRVTSIGTDLH